MTDEKQLQEQADEEMINQGFQELLDSYLATKHRKKVEIITKAFNFAKQAHKGVKRRSGEPYIMHPIAVAKIVCTEIGLGSTSICSALLHDVVEDTDYTVEDIENLFGSKIAQIVDGLTKISGGIFGDRASAQAENFKKLLLTMSDDIRVILIKIADRLHNMRTLGSMLPNKQYKIAGETLYIYAPLANRLGLNKIKTELEDLSFRYEHPEEYAQIEAKLQETQAEREEVFREFTAPIRERLDKMGISYRLMARVKSPYSIWNKMQTKHITFEEIYDLTAVRIIVDTVKDCYAVLGMVHTMWIPMPGRFKDYIAMPKPNLYQSLHTTVIGPDGEPVEIQIRTHEMHEIAENGIAAHWKYKEGITGNQDAKMEQKLKWLRQMMEWEKDVQDPHEFLDALKDDVFNSQVYVFTPRGDVIELPAGSTPIDFAYRVHTNVGNKCTGAKINGKIVPINYKLQNGEIVEVITSANSPGPSRDWLSIVQTPTARNRIRQWFKKERREENVERGTDILEKEFKRYNIPYKNASIQKFLTQVAKKFNQPSLEDLIATIGYGGIATSQVMPKVRDFYNKEVNRQEKEKRMQEKEDKIKKNFDEHEYAKKRKKKDNGITVKGLDNILVRFAKCCNPLPGDDIVGYITKGRGVAIHRRDCTNIKLDDEFLQNRLVEVEWNNPEKSKFEGEVKIIAVDRVGLLNDIIHVVSMEKLSISGINCRVLKDNTANISLLVEVNDISELKQLMKKIKSISGVDDVSRMRN